MKFNKLSIIKKFFVCSIGNLLSRAITISISFFTINLLTPSEYGLFALLNTFIAVIPIFFNLGLRQAFGLEYFHKNEIERKLMLNDVILIYLLIASPLFFLFLIFSPLINRYFFMNQISPHLLFIALSICFLHFFSELTFQILRYESKVNFLALIQILMGFTTGNFTFIFIYFFKLKITGIILAQLFGILIVAIYGFFSFFYLKNFLIKKNITFYYLKLGFPFIPSILFSCVLSFGDKLILAKYTTLYNVGIYSLADSFTHIFQITILAPLTASYLPYIFKKFSESKDKILEIEKWNIKNMYLAMLSLFFIVTLGFFSCKKLFYFLIPVKYYESINYIYFILLEQIIFMGSYFATCYLQFLKRTYLLVSFTVFAAILNTLFSLILIPYFLISGCIIATLIAQTIYLITIILVTKYIQKNQKIIPAKSLEELPIVNLKQNQEKIHFK